MFATTRDAGVRRRSRLYSANRSARSSKISLLTINTSSSGGSNSTITQESYNRSHGKSSHRRRRTKEHRSRSHRMQDEDGHDGSQAEVFDYLVENENDRDKAAVKSKTEPAIDNDDNDDSDSLSTPEVILHHDDDDVEGYYRSMSDSGISMASSSSGKSISGFQPDSRLPVLPEEPSSRPTSSHHTSGELTVIDPRWAWHSSSPVPFSDDYIPPPVPQPPHILYENPLYQSYPYSGYNSPSPELNSFEHFSPRLNIREPSDHGVKPMSFRPFSKMSNRLLLQMQDEIAEMEEEVLALDEDSDDADDALEDEVLPDLNARRNCKIRRDYLYKELHGKLDQYYHSLDMMQKVEEFSKPAASSDLTKHQAWLESRIFPSSKIPRLLQPDLRSFKSRSLESLPVETPSLHFQHLAYSALVHTALPLLLFKQTTNVLNRLILLSTVVVIGASVQGRRKIKFVRDDLTCTILCIFISIFAAICV